MQIGGKKTCQIDAKNIKNLHCQRKNFKNLTCQCKIYIKFALPMQIGGKKTCIANAKNIKNYKFFDPFSNFLESGSTYFKKNRL